MKKKICMLLLLAAITVPSYAQFNWQKETLTGLIVAGAAADYTTTRIGLAKGAREANPLLAWPLRHEPVGGIMYAGLTGLQVYAVRRTLTPNASKKAKIGTLAFVIGNSVLKYYLVRNNIRVIETLNRRNGR